MIKELPTLIIDQDQVITETVLELLSRYNLQYGTNFTENDIQTYNLSETLGKKAYKIFEEEGFFTSLKPIKGSIEVMNRLWHSGLFKILIVSAAEPYSYREKKLWIQKYLPFFPQDDIKFEKDKYKIQGDLLLDDYCLNLINYKNVGIPVVFNQPYNQNIEVDRVNDWYEFEKLVYSIFYPNKKIESA